MKPVKQWILRTKSGGEFCDFVFNREINISIETGQAVNLAYKIW
jgi:hypothetical protein